MLFLTAITLLAVFAILSWRGPFLGLGFGAAASAFIRIFRAVPCRSGRVRQGPILSAFLFEGLEDVQKGITIK
jgi:hypothetical protein